MAFNSEQFLSTVISQSASTKSIAVPEGDFVAVVTKIGVRSIKMDDEDRVIFEVTWEPSDPSGIIESTTGRKKNTVRQGVFLDLTPEGGIDLAKGMNVSLGRLRDALGQNKDGEPWNFQMVMGRTARIYVSHKIDNKTGDVYANVEKVAAL